MKKALFLCIAITLCTIGTALAQTNNIYLGNSSVSATGDENTFIGASAGTGTTTNSQNTYLGFNATGGAAITNAAAIGANALVSANNNIILGNVDAHVGIGITEGPAQLTVHKGGLIAFPDMSIPMGTNYNQTCASTGTAYLHDFTQIISNQANQPINGGLFSFVISSTAGNRNSGTISLASGDDAAMNLGLQGSASGVDADRNWGVYGDAIVDDGYLNIALVGIMGDCATPCDASRVNYGVYGECPSACGGGGTGYAGFFNGDINVTGSTYNISDQQFKTGITPLNNALDKIKLLQPMQYQFKTDKYPQVKFDSRTHMGIIAQDLEKVFPNLVKNNMFPKTDSKGITYDAFNYKSVDYVELIPVAIEAIKELDNKIEELKALKGGSSNAALTGTSTNTKGAVLNQNAPNPFGNQTSISYFIPDDVNSSMLMVIDIKGEVKLKFDNLSKGNGQVKINGADLEPGTYFYSLFCDNEFVATKKMIQLGE